MQELWYYVVMPPNMWVRLPCTQQAGSSGDAGCWARVSEAERGGCEALGSAGAGMLCGL